VKLKGLIFDMDGTLVDNLAYHFLAFDEYAKRKGPNEKESYFNQYNI